MRCSYVRWHLILAMIFRMEFTHLSRDIQKIIVLVQEAIVHGLMMLSLCLFNNNQLYQNHLKKDVATEEEFQIYKFGTLLFLIDKCQKICIYVLIIGT